MWRSFSAGGNPAEVVCHRFHVVLTHLPPYRIGGCGCSRGGALMNSLFFYLFGSLVVVASLEMLK